MAHQIIHRGAILGGGGLINPWDVPGLSLMLHAPYENGGEPAELSAHAQNPILTTGDSIQTVTDWSGTAHPTQATATKQPTWNTALINGESGYLMDGSNDNWLVSFAGGVKLWIAGVVTSGAGALGFLLHWGVTFNFQEWEILQSTGGASNSIGRRGISGSKINMGGSWGVGISTDLINFLISDAKVEMIGEKSGVNVLTGATSGPETTPLGGATQNLEIGARGSSLAFNGNIGTLLIYTTIPTVDERAGVNAWLNSKWGL